jgi:hypothetical protein
MAPGCCRHSFCSVAVEGTPDAAVIPAAVDVRAVVSVLLSGSLSFTCWYGNNGIHAAVVFPVPAASYPFKFCYQKSFLITVFRKHTAE